MMNVIIFIIPLSENVIITFINIKIGVSNIDIDRRKYIYILSLIIKNLLSFMYAAEYVFK